MSMKKKSKVHEVSHAHKQELEFKAEARRKKLVGLWAAEKMGLEGDAAGAYATEVIISDLEEPGVNDVVRKVMADFADKNVAVTEDQLREELETQLKIARGQVQAENES